MSWLDKLTGLWTRRPDADERVGPATPPEQWTVPGIRFDTTGWKLVDSSATVMSWSSPNATLVLTREDLQEGTETIGLTALRNQHRADARATGADVVALEIVGAPRGEVVQTLWKRTSGAGHAYKGRIEFSSGPYLFQIEIDADEGSTTGTREAMVNAMRVNHGEFALGPQNEDGSFKVQGLLIDAYDPAFDEGALNAVSDDERLDILLPAHPLSRVRATLRAIIDSLDLDEGPPPQAPAGQDGAISGPRRQLSLPVLRGLFAAGERFELVEQSFQEELATMGESPSLQLAALLRQLGIHQHLRDRPANAVPTLARAEALFAELTGDDSGQTAVTRAHHGIALVKLGRHGQALPLLLRAIGEMERTPVDAATYVLALANAAQLLAREGDQQRAGRYLQRAQKMMAREPRW